MCEFCDPNCIEIPSDMTAQIEKLGEIYGLCMRVNGVRYGISIDFCPICGRKLVEEEI